MIAEEAQSRETLRSGLRIKKLIVKELRGYGMIFFFLSSLFFSLNDNT